MMLQPLRPRKMDLASSTIFVTEVAEQGTMEKPTPKMNIFLGKALIIKIIKNSIPLALGLLCIYLRAYQNYNLVIAQTATFVGWLLGHILLALNLKQEKTPLTIQGIFSNLFGAFWLCAMIMLSIIITSIPQLYPYVNSTNLPIIVWIEVITIITLSTCWIEIAKLIRYNKTNLITHSPLQK